MQDSEYDSMYDLEDSHWWFAAKRRFASKLISKWFSFAGRPLILDAGCGTGRNLEMLSGYGPCAGVDINHRALQYCRRRSLDKLCRASVMELPFRDGCFDMVSVFDVLYHKAVDDRKALGELRRVLKKGGRIIVTDSALECLRGPHDEAVHGARRYTKAELREKMEEAGLKVQKASYMYAFVFPLVFFVRRLRRVQDLRPLDGMNWMSAQDLPSLHGREQGHHLPSLHGRGRGRVPGHSSRSDVSRVPWLLNKLLVLLMAVESFLLLRFDLPFGSSVICIGSKT